MARKHKGQSLLEFAISAALLIMLLSGIVDLGRAYFARVAMDSIISEGAHWAAAYPGCIPTANNASDASYIPPECRGTNSVVGRMLNENNDLARSRFTAMSFSPLTAAPGDDFTISVSYRMDTVTPFITAMFGPSWTLTAEVKEVVRGAGIPNNPGTPMADQGGINPVRVVSNFQQAGGCNSGNVTLSWTAVPASGYYIYRDKQTTPPYINRLATITPGGTPGATLTWTAPLGYGNSQDYTITAFNDVGGVITESPPAFLPIPAHCSQIKPTIDPPPSGWICASGVLPFGAVTFNWTMPAPIDADVTGYQVLRVDPGPSYILVATVSGGSTTTSPPYNFTSSGPGSDQNKPYVVRPVLSGVPDPTNDSDPVTIDCLPGTGLTGQYFNGMNGGIVPPDVLVTSQTDATVGFTWGIGSPAPGVGSDNFSVHWTGKLKAKYSEIYTFCISSDDGKRMWFDGSGTPNIDDWNIHSETETCWATPSSLVAETRYNIEIRYFENAGLATIKLYWQSASQPKEIVPQSYLYP